MDRVEIINFDDVIENISLYAHTKEGKVKETLREHSNLTIKYFRKIMKEKNLNFIINRLISNIVWKNSILNEQELDMIRFFIINGIYYHDIGKINPCFQEKQMKNKLLFSDEINNSQHSAISSVLYVDLMMMELDKLNRTKMKKLLEYSIYVFAYFIARHHTSLKNFEEFAHNFEVEHLKIKDQKEFIKYYKKELKEIDFNDFFLSVSSRTSMQKKIGKNGVDLFILGKLFYSLLIASDYYATYEYMNEEINEFGVIDEPLLQQFLGQYQETHLYKGIKRYEAYIRGENSIVPFEENSINKLRTQMFLEAEENLLKNINENIYYLEAPTGGGKTNTSINLALQLLKKNQNLNKIFYIFPFNTLIEQTKEALDDIFEKENRSINIINSITPITCNEKEDDEYTEEDFEKAYMERLFLHYPIVMTTHVKMFSYLFGTKKESNFGLIHLANSVVILDEIQSYRNIIWKEIIYFLYEYSEKLNMKIIIMSATLPKLDKLLDEDNKAFVSLIENTKKYFENKVFKERVALDFSFLEESLKGIEVEEKIEDLANKICELWQKEGQKRILVELISKKTARLFFNIIKKKLPNKYIIELTGDDNRLERKKTISLLKQENKNAIRDCMIVATQVIEAGVDIDMDIGFKSISILDSEEQFLGRINRSCKKSNCKAYFFLLDDPKKIYKEELRTEKSLEDIQYRGYLEEKNFEEFYKDTFEEIEYKKSSANKDNMQVIYNYVAEMNFLNIEKNMKLIKADEAHRLFINTTITSDEEIYVGSEIWESYKNIILDDALSYSKKQVLLSRVKEKMDCFTYNYYKPKGEPNRYDEKFGDIYYIKNGEDYMTEDGKFDRLGYAEADEGYIL